MQSAPTGDNMGIFAVPPSQTPVLGGRPSPNPSQAPCLLLPDQTLVMAADMEPLHQKPSRPCLHRGFWLAWGAGGSSAAWCLAQGARALAKKKYVRWQNTVPRHSSCQKSASQYLHSSVHPCHLASSAGCFLYAHTHRRTQEENTF